MFKTSLDTELSPILTLDLKPPVTPLKKRRIHRQVAKAGKDRPSAKKSKKQGDETARFLSPPSRILASFASSRFKLTFFQVSQLWFISLTTKQWRPQ
jgi:hypothetical protein